MHALRMVRAYTGRDKVLKFEGGYHGGHDTVLVSVKPPRAKVGHVPHAAARWRWATASPRSPIENTLVAHLERRRRACATLLERHENEVAAVIVEPVMMNVGVMPPRDGFLQELRALCDEFGCLLVFDEVKTGAKLAWGGAQQCFGVKADVVCLAKAIGGGLPLGRVRRAPRDHGRDRVSSARSTPAPTPATRSPPPPASPRSEKILATDVFPKATALGDALAEGHNKIIKKHGHPWCAVNVGANGTVFWRKTPPTNYREWLDQDFDAFWRYWHMNLNRGVIPQAQCYDEQWTVSALHTREGRRPHAEVFDEIAREMK